MRTLALLRCVPPALVALLTLWLGATVRAQEASEPGAQSPFLWRIEGDVPSYLFGTIHLPDPRVLELPAAVEAAFASADAVYGELDLDLDAIREVGAATQLPRGQQLKDVLPEATYERLRECLRGKGLPMPMFERMRPWAVATQLPMLEKLREFAGRQPMDMTLLARARQADKEVGGLETVAEQIGVFDGFSAEEQATLLDEALTQMAEAEAEGEDMLETIVQLYLEGDLDGILELMDHDAEGDPELAARFEKLLLWDRNVRMAERIGAKLKEHPDRSYFFAVGAAHYATEGGVDGLLREAGYEVRRLGATGDPIEEPDPGLREQLESLSNQIAELERTLADAERALKEIPDDDGELRRAIDGVRGNLEVIRAKYEDLRQRVDATEPRRKAG